MYWDRLLFFLIGSGLPGDILLSSASTVIPLGISRFLLRLLLLLKINLFLNESYILIIGNITFFGDSFSLFHVTSKD